MRDGGRLAAALEVLSDFNTRRVPLKVSLADWARGARFAGSKDRAFVSGLAMEVLRRQRSLMALGHDSRGAVASVLLHQWGWDADRVFAAYADEPHGPGPIETHILENLVETPPGSIEMPVSVRADVPDFVLPMLERVWDDLDAECQANSARAPFDLRINTIKADPERVLRALDQYNPALSPLAVNGVRLPMERSETKSPNLTITPAFQKGWIEVQDEGSQIAALASGALDGAQVLDFCAGGGGKTLALAALMGNAGQIYAYDKDPARLAPAFGRLSRSGVRNAQIISPSENADKLEKLFDKMDLVFVDAPCSGSGTWRRRPDTKWRLTEAQLESRMAEQDEVLAQAAAYVAPGGALIYVTCSMFAEENEDRIASFLMRNAAFSVVDPIAPMRDTGGLTPAAASILSPLVSSDGTLKLSPLNSGTDAFGVTRLLRATSDGK